MLKKTCNVLATSALLLGLSACGINNDDKDTALNDLNNDRENTDISASFTTSSSDQYPHTKAVPVQDAKYNFVPINANEEAELQKEMEQDPQQVQQQDQQHKDTTTRSATSTTTNTKCTKVTSEYSW